MPEEAKRAALMRRRAAIKFRAAAALLLVIVGLVGWTLLDARRAARAVAERNEANIAMAVERNIGRMISGLDLSLLAVVRAMATPGLRQMAPDLQNALLFSGAVAAENQHGVFVTDEHGQIIFDGPPQAPRTSNVGERPYFLAQRDHDGLGLLISEPLHSRADGSWGVTLSRRINHADGSFAGVAVVGLPLSTFNSLLGGFDVGADGSLAVLSTRSGALLAGWPAGGRPIGAAAADRAALAQRATHPGETEERVSRHDGIRRLFSYRVVDGGPLMVSVGLSTAEIYAGWWQKAALLAGVLTLLVGAKLWLAWALRREMGRRVDAELMARRSAAAAASAATALQRAVAPIEALFRHSSDTMLVARRMPAGDFQYEAVNPTWEALVGVPAAAAIGRDPRSVLPAHLVEAVITGWQACLRDQQATRFSFEAPMGSGRRWESMVLPVPNPDGLAERLVVVGREMTEHDRLEAALRQSQKMEVIGRLAAGVAHDFNDILQAIGSGVELLGNEAGLSAEGSDMLDMVARSTRRGAYLTHHLLAYSRKQKLQPNLLEIGAVLADVTAILRRTLASDIAVSLAVADGIGRVRADRAQLETALMNLSINASHAMPGGGELHFAARRALGEPLGEGGEAWHVVIAVTDSGTGMAPEVLACAFEPFFTTKGLEGTGLGLASVQGFCRQSGGDVRVSSELGVGTRFEIWLPEVADAPAERRAAPAVVAAPAGRRVLLVDDAPDVLVTLTAFLSKGGHLVRHAGDGLQALVLVQAGERFDLLITDFMMPGMKGPELIRAVRRVQPGLPALLISGYADASDGLDDLPDVGWLHKPFQRDKLLVQVGTLLGRAGVTAGGGDADRLGA